MRFCVHKRLQGVWLFFTKCFCLFDFYYIQTTILNPPSFALHINYEEWIKDKWKRVKTTKVKVYERKLFLFSLPEENEWKF